VTVFYDNADYNTGYVVTCAAQHLSTFQGKSGTTESSLELHGSINILILPSAGCCELLFSVAASTVFTFLVSNFFCFSENHTNISSLWTSIISSKG
jgi:hypothetical protein